MRVSRVYLLPIVLARFPAWFVTHFRNISITSLPEVEMGELLTIIKVKIIFPCSLSQPTIPINFTSTRKYHNWFTIGRVSFISVYLPRQLMLKQSRTHGKKLGDICFKFFFFVPRPPKNDPNIAEKQQNFERIGRASCRERV